MAHRQTRGGKQQNQPSKLLSNNENQALFRLVGGRSVTLASAVVQVFVADPPSCNRWSKKCCGVACFVKDNPKRSYYIRVYDLRSGATIWEQEIYNQFKYKDPRPYFHTFDTDDSPAAINFSNEDEANLFKAAVQDKLSQRSQRRMERKRTSHHTSRPARPANTAPPPAPSPVSSTSQMSTLPVSNVDSGKDTLKKKNKDKKGGKKVKLTKDQISQPTDFRHVGHVGWDPENGFDMNNLDPNLKQLFDKVGITENQLQDKETAHFIYDFIEQHGGLEGIKQQTNILPPPPMPKAPMVPSHAPPMMSSNAAPPPPPPSRVKMGGAAPPPPMIHQAPPRPPPSRSRGGAPPPPPPGRGPARGMGAPPPPPPPSREPRGGPPPPPGPPSMAPPPPPPMMPASSAPPPPPPPPPPPGMPPPPMGGPPPMMGGGGGGPPPPPAPDGRNDLLSAIRGAKQGTLKHVDAETNAAPSRNALLDQIRTGGSLKPVDQSAMDRPKSMGTEDGLAGALARALATRHKTIQGDDDDDDDDVEDDDEDEWDD